MPLKDKGQTTDKIKQILEERTLDLLIGLKEDSWFDAKGCQGYDLSTPQGRIDLAKDVTGFANSEGGHIIVGLRTKIVTEERTEIVDALSFVARTDFSISQYNGVIREHVHPKISGLAVDWIESPKDPERGLGTIWVPAQEENRKFFLMTRVIEAGQEIKQIVFGIAKRSGSSTEPLTCRQLYDMTQRGQSDVAQRLTRIEDKLASILHKVSQQEHDPETSSIDLENKIRKIIYS